FAVTQAGTERAVERLTVLDAVRHTAASAGSLPAIEITPDQIHRTIAIVVDDLCMTADGLREARRELYALSGKLTPGDRVAILRSSSGTAREQQFSDAGRQ